MIRRNVTTTQQQAGVAESVVMGEGEGSSWRSFSERSLSLLRMSGAVFALTLLPFSVCEAMNKCEQPDGGFIYQERRCAGNTQSTTFSDQELKAQNRQEEAVREANEKVLAAPPVSSSPSYGRVQPLVHEVEVGAGRGRASSRSSGAPNEIHGLTKLLIFLSGLALAYFYIIWPFWVARWARYNGQSFIAWFLISLICSPLLSTLFLRMSDGPNKSPNRGKMWQRFAVAGILLSLAGFSAAWDRYRDSSEFQHDGQKAVVEPVSEYTLEKTTYSDGTSKSKYVVEARFVTADGRNITASRILPEELAVKLINGGKVELTYLSNQPEKVRFEGESTKKNDGGLVAIVLLLISLLAWWVSRKARATAAEVWK